MNLINKYSFDGLIFKHLRQWFSRWLYSTPLWGLVGFVSRNIEVYGGGGICNGLTVMVVTRTCTRTRSALIHAVCLALRVAKWLRSGHVDVTFIIIVCGLEDVD